MKKYDLNTSTVLFLGFLAVFFGVFLFYPISYMLRGAFGGQGEFTLKYFGLILASPLQRESIFNSFVIAITTTVLTTLLTLPMAHVMTRYRFGGKGFLSSLLLVPMIMPPFVGALGLKQILAKYGSLNLSLIHLGISKPESPIDWLGDGGMGGVIILQVLSLYPIMFLNVSAAMANIDPSLRESAQNLGAGGWRLFRSVTLPLCPVF